MLCFSTQDQEEEHGNAFDLTWHNYLPSCACFPQSSNAIRLADDDPDHLFIAPSFYNDHLPDELLPQRGSRRHKKRSKKRRRHKKNYTSSSQSEYDDLFTSESQDAEFLQDDHIAQIPKGTYYAERSVPTPFVIGEQTWEPDNQSPTDREWPQASVSAAAQAAQAILGERLDDLTEKLVLIRNNMMHMNSHEDNDDAATIHTLKTIRRHANEDDDSDHPPTSSSRYPQEPTASPPIDIPTSSILHHNSRRFSSNITADFGQFGSSPSSAPKNHPFSYFTQQELDASDQASLDPPLDKDSGLQGILNLSKWFG
ncbi:hypothetical protein DM01DRAFT_1405629 [Hesseltinella vesiculosa]|uniref:Uncharacterized protein n=1 Tax=Hesseltinella vesiculosa TaxID=101127 RepID=A0A1X2GQN6_9FUNG|nr:hypothetical protein DM01DRAFT_1405629 [Hesseltinella vesiculosa]